MGRRPGRAGPLGRAPPPPDLREARPSLPGGGPAVPDREDAQDWIDRNQLSRRNLTDDQRRLLRGRMYNRRKKQGERKDLTSGQSDPKFDRTSSTVAAQFGVSEKTVRRDGKFAEEVEREPELLGAVVAGEPVRKVRREIALRVRREA
jgi:hypothetical protein